MRQICRYLQTKRVWFTRLQNVGIWDEKKKSRRKNWYMRKGVPDILLILNNTLVAVEVKSPTGILTPGQEEFARLWECAGGIYLLVRDVSDIIKAGL